MKNDNGGFYVPDLNIDTIEMWQVADGYAIFVTCATELVVVGQPLNVADHPIELMPNQWNSVAYLQAEALPVATQLASIADRIVIVKDHSGRIWVPGLDINTIDAQGGMQPGLGYQVFINGETPVSFTYPVPAVLAEQPLAKKAKKSGQVMGQSATTADRLVKKADRGSDWLRDDPHFSYFETGLPYPIIVNGVSLPDGQPFTAGDEIAVFDGDLCVGGFVFETDFPVSFAAWQSDPEFNLPGFEPGNVMHFRAWDAEQEAEVEMDAIYEVGDGTFGDGLYSVVTLVPAGVNVEEPDGQNEQNEQKTLPTAFGLMQSFPNPFSPDQIGRTVIRFQLPVDCRVQLRVFNMAGQLVRTLVDGTRSAGYEQVFWDGRNDSGDPVSSGMYLYEMQAFATGRGDGSGTIQAPGRETEFRQVQRLLVLR